MASFSYLPLLLHPYLGSARLIGAAALPLLADYYAYSRAGDSTHQGLMLVLNDGSSTPSKGLSSPFKSATLPDKTSNYAGTITPDANSYGNFPVNGRGWWCGCPTSRLATKARHASSSSA